MTAIFIIVIVISFINWVKINPVICTNVRTEVLFFETTEISGVPVSARKNSELNPSGCGLNDVIIARVNSSKRFRQRNENEVLSFTPVYFY